MGYRQLHGLPHPPSPRRAAAFALGLGGVGAVLANFGYLLGSASPNPLEVGGPVVFWLAVVFFLLGVPFRGATLTFARYVRTSLGAGAFALYLGVHLLLYGFLFEGLLAAVYGGGYFATTVGWGYFAGSPPLLLTTNVYLPALPANTLFDLAYNPVANITAPPVFSAALSFYSIAVALVIAVLVVANIGRTRELGALCTLRGRARTFVALPALGIVLGASCCLSVAGVVALAAPSVAALTSTPWVYYATYFLFPFVAIALLYANLRSVERISATVSDGTAARPSNQPRRSL